MWLDKLINETTGYDNSATCGSQPKTTSTYSGTGDPKTSFLHTFFLQMFTKQSNTQLLFSLVTAYIRKRELSCHADRKKTVRAKNAEEQRQPSAPGGKRARPGAGDGSESA